MRRETELKKEKEHIGQALKINVYLNWMLGKPRSVDQPDPAEEE